MFETINKNSGVLCITEYPSMLGAISGWGNIDMSNEMLSYMSNKDNHIKFTEYEFVQLCLKDESANKINNFGDLRHIIQNAVIDGYMAYINDKNSCLYYDLSWNCMINTDYYASDDNSNALHTVSDSIFASVCCV